MRELSGLGLAANHAVLELPAPARPETRGERLAGAVLYGIFRVWCLPFLVLAWILTWAAIAVLRGTELLTAAVPKPAKRPAAPAASALPGGAARRAG